MGEGVKGDGGGKKRGGELRQSLVAESVQFASIIQASTNLTGFALWKKHMEFLWNFFFGSVFAPTLASKRERNFFLFFFGPDSGVGGD